MKISKKPACKQSNDVKASTALLCNETETCCGKYDAAIELISAAIEALSVVAKDDVIAKDSIANLGVVMLDLRGGC